MRTIIAVVILVLISVHAGASIIEGQQVWHPEGWRNRIFFKINRRPGSQEGFIEFYSGGLCRKDGSDIIVVDAHGKVMPRQITTIGPGDRYLVTFQLTESNSYVLYYNNPDPSGVPIVDHSQKGGLLLNVYELVGDRCKDVDDLTLIVRDSKTLIGSGYRKRVFDGYNPYGETDNYLAVYTGHLDIKESGTYRFATNSNDASFLFIDSKLVTSFPGKHFAWATQGQKSGKVRLSQGHHRIHYYHVEFMGGQAAVAGWKPPGASEFEVIPEDAFVPICGSKVARRESKGTDFYDFTFSYGDVLHTDAVNDAPIIEVAFQPYILDERKVREVSWDFGDGSIVREKEPSRLFLKPGLYTVKMSVIDKKDVRHTMTHVIPVYPIERYNTRNPEETSDRFHKMLAGCSLKSLDYERLLTLFRFYVSRDDVDMAAAIGSRLMSLLPDAKADEKTRFLNQFGRFLDNKPFTHSVLREKIYTGVISLTGNERAAEEARLKLAKAYYEQGQKLEKARELYDQLIAKGGMRFQREALIGRGNVALDMGRADRAAEYYQLASALRTGLVWRLMLPSLYAFAIESRIRNGDCCDALVLLDKLESRTPAIRLEGHTLMLRILALQKLGDNENALRYLKVVVDNLGPTSYTAEAYASLITLLRGIGRLDEANKYLGRFREEYPNSRLLETAHGEKAHIAELGVGKDE